MPATIQTLRYQLPKKAVKSDCPQCGSKHRKTWSRYVDTRTGELLPESYGRCDRESNCGYHLSPYQKTASGLSYADEVYQEWKRDSTSIHWHKMTRSINNPSTVRQLEISTIHTIPDQLFHQSLGHYERNQFARLLEQQFGQTIASELLQRFQIGTSKRWPGACVFWYIDEQGRIRGGQIKLFGFDWHTERYIDRNGKRRSKTSWVHSALTHRLKRDGAPLPEWLVKYNQYGNVHPVCLD